MPRTRRQTTAATSLCCPCSTACVSLYASFGICRGLVHSGPRQHAAHCPRAPNPLVCRCGGLALPPMEFEVASTLSLPSGIPGLPSSMPTLPSPASLPSLGSAASLQSLQSGLGSGRLASSSHPATPSFPAGSLGSGAAAAASSLPASPFGSPPSPPPTPGTLPSLRLPSYEGAGSSTQGAVAAGEQEQHQQWSLQHASSQHAQHADNHHRQLDERQALQFQIERLALVVRL